jgi:YD repeat-containing protein
VLSAAALAFVLITAVSEPADGISVVERPGALRLAVTDLAFPTGSLGLDRTYWSNRSHRGLFGPGWGSRFDTTLALGPDGSVDVDDATACPGCAVAFPEKSAERMADALRGVARVLARSGRSPLAVEAIALAAALDASPDLRQTMWLSDVAAFRRAMAGPRGRAFDTGSRLRRVAVLPSGFVRYEPGGDVEEYDPAGRLVRVVESSGGFVEAERAPDGALLRLLDHRGRWIAFEHGAEGLVVAAKASDGLETSYGYDGEGRLAWSDSAAGQRTTYAYNGQTTALAKVASGEGSTRVRYDHGRVAFLSRPDGTRTAWSRTTAIEVSGAGVTFEYSSRSEQFGPSPAEEGDETSDDTTDAPPVSWTEYTWRESRDEELGRHLDERRRATSTGTVTTTRYDPWWQLPTDTDGPVHPVHLDYDDLGRLTHASTPFEARWLAYGAEDRVEAVYRVGSNGADPVEVDFEYDAGDLLSRAWDTDGREVIVHYDDAGRITGLAAREAGEAVQVSFEYDALGNVARMRREGDGSTTDPTPTADGSLQPARARDAIDDARAVRKAAGLLLELVNAARPPPED